MVRARIKFYAFWKRGSNRRSLFNPWGHPPGWVLYYVVGAPGDESYTWWFLGTELDSVKLLKYLQDARTRDLSWSKWPAGKKPRFPAALS